MCDDITPIVGNVLYESNNITFALQRIILCAINLTHRKRTNNNEGVSFGSKDQETHMAQAKRTSQRFGAAAGALLAGAAVLAPLSAAYAEEAKPVSQPGAEAESVWNDELRALHEASMGASDYAENNYGVGIVMHVGDDFPNEHFQTAQEAADVLVAVFEQRYGTPAKAFLRPNPGTPGTGLTFHIGPTIHGADNGTEVKNFSNAISAMPDVVQQLKIVKDIASVEYESPAPTGG